MGVTLLFLPFQQDHDYRMAEMNSHWDGPNPGPDNTPFGEGRRVGVDVVNWRGLDYEVSPLPTSEIHVGLL